MWLKTIFVVLVYTKNTELITMEVQENGLMTKQIQLANANQAKHLSKPNKRQNLPYVGLNQGDSTGMVTGSKQLSF